MEVLKAYNRVLRILKFTILGVLIISIILYCQTAALFILKIPYTNSYEYICDISFDEFIKKLECFAIDNPEFVSYQENGKYGVQNIISYNDKTSAHAIICQENNEIGFYIYNIDENHVGIRLNTMMLDGATDVIKSHYCLQKYILSEVPNYHNRLYDIRIMGHLFMQIFIGEDAVIFVLALFFIEAIVLLILKAKIVLDKCRWG